MNTRRITPVVLILTLAAGACAFDDRDRPIVSVRDSAGLTVVESSGGDAPLALTVERITDLVPPDSALTAVPWGIAADPATGRIYVADRTSPRVVVFDRSGAYAGTLGREGDGPGEFRSPSAAFLDPRGALAIWDTGRGILSRWSPAGEVLDEERTPASYWGPGFAVGADWLVMVTNETESAGMLMRQRLVARTGGGATVLHEVPMELAMMELPCATMPAPKLFAPSVIWTSHGDTVHVLKGPGYRIDTYAAGVPVRSIRRDVGPIAVTEDLAVAGVESGPGPYRAFMRRCGVTAEQLAAAVGHEDTASPIQSLAAGPGGRLWATRTTDGVTPDALDILDADGAYVGTVATSVIPAAFLSDSLFVGLRLEESGATVASLYQVRDTGA